MMANVFPKLQTVENFERPPVKSAVSEHALTVDLWKCHKYLQNLL